MAPSQHQKSWLTASLVGLAALSCVNGAAVDRHPRLVKTDTGNIPNEVKCKMPFNHRNQVDDKAAWVDSGAGSFLSRFLKEHGVEDWSSDLLAQTAFKGSQGGSSDSCTDVTLPTCGSPHGCLTYEPVEAFFIHQQISNLFAAMQKLRTRHTEAAVSAISYQIHDIVENFGVVRDDGSAAIFKALLAVVGSLTGVAGAVGASGSASAPFVGTALGLFSTVVGFGSPGTPKSAEAVQGEITATYGKMFESAMDQINGTVRTIFGAPTGKKRLFDPTVGLRPLVDEERVHMYFKDGIWLDSLLIGDVVETYGKNTEKKMVELCLIEAMKSNEHPYKLRITPSGGDGNMNQGSCDAKKACHWYDNHCLCLVQQTVADAFRTQQYSEITDSEVNKVNSYVQNYNEALENNYHCIKQSWDSAPNHDHPRDIKPGDRGDPPAFDPTNLPPNYFSCFWNLDWDGDMVNREY